jgi:hypothetical protein
MFEWQQQGDIFIASFPNGRAVITERRQRGFGVPIGGEYAYDARLEDAAGTVLDSISDMRLFEDAEDWVTAVLPAHRRHFYADSRAALLQRCQRMFDPTSEALFVAWMDGIIAWVRSGRDVPARAVAAVPDLTWEQTADGWRARGPAGLELAIVASNDPTSAYRIGGHDQHFQAEIRHRSGAMLRAHQRFGVLNLAQDWIAEHIGLLVSPGIDEPSLPGIELTLLICQRLVDGDGAAFGILGDLFGQLADRYL